LRALRLNTVRVAFAETDIFLLQLLALPVVMKNKPELCFNPSIDGYEICNVQLRLEAANA
jgi:hypothetical protein